MRLTYSPAAKAARLSAKRTARRNGYTIEVHCATADDLDVELMPPDGHLVGGRDTHSSVFATDPDEESYCRPGVDVLADFWRSIERDASTPPERCPDLECEHCTE